MTKEGLKVYRNPRVHVREQTRQSTFAIYPLKQISHRIFMFHMDAFNSSEGLTPQTPLTSYATVLTDNFVNTWHVNI